MKQKRIAEPDYKFKLEHMKGYNLAGKVDSLDLKSYYKMYGGRSENPY